MGTIATAEINVKPNTDGLVRTARIIAKHLTALADELEHADADSPEPDHVPGARPPRY